MHTFSEVLWWLLTKDIVKQFQLKTFFCLCTPGSRCSVDLTFVAVMCFHRPSSYRVCEKVQVKRLRLFQFLLHRWWWWYLSQFVDVCQWWCVIYSVKCGAQTGDWRKLCRPPDGPQHTFIWNSTDMYRWRTLIWSWIHTVKSSKEIQPIP